MISGWHDLATCKKAIDQEQPVIVMPASYCYIDMKQNAFERGHTWAWLVDTRRIYSLQPDKLTTDPLKKNMSEGSKLPYGLNYWIVQTVFSNTRVILDSALWLK